MYRYSNKGKVLRAGFWTGFAFFLLFTLCCSDKGISEALPVNELTKGRIKPGEIKPGLFIQCVQTFERKMKNVEEHSKNIITLQGIVTQIKLPDIYMKVSNVSSLNLKRENLRWVRNHSVVKRPPYSIGQTYPFAAKHNVINNVIYEGVNEIKFELP